MENGQYEIEEQIYCKYCYKDVCHEIGPDGSLIVCSECGSGLAPIQDVIEMGSHKAWREKIEKEYYDKYCKDFA